MNKTIFYLDPDDDRRLPWVQQTYASFLHLETSTGENALWVEQKKVYEAILNAPDPEAAAQAYYRNGKTARQIAMERLAGKEPT